MARWEDERRWEGGRERWGEDERGGPRGFEGHGHHGERRPAEEGGWRRHGWHGEERGGPQWEELRGGERRPLWGRGDWGREERVRELLRERDWGQGEERGPGGRRFSSEGDYTYGYRPRGWAGPYGGALGAWDRAGYGAGSGDYGRGEYPRDEREWGRDWGREGYGADYGRGEYRLEYGTPERRDYQYGRGHGRAEERGPFRQVAERIREGYRRTLGRGPKGYRRGDDRIRDDVCERIARSGVNAEEVEVRVENGEVTLTGEVEHRDDKRILEDIAEDVFGVVGVQNSIRVNRGFDPGVAARAAPAAGSMGRSGTEAEQRERGNQEQRAEDDAGAVRH
jgi:hypothetical protein